MWSEIRYNINYGVNWIENRTLNLLCKDQFSHITHYVKKNIEYYISGPKSSLGNIYQKQTAQFIKVCFTIQLTQ